MPVPLPDLDLGIAAAGLIIGFLVGMTGIGGGALTTPILVLVFKVPALTAVGSDLVASVAMKLVGGGVHWRRGTVNTGLVRWLSAGSLPAAFGGVALLRLADPAGVEDVVTRALGGSLLLAVAAMAVRPIVMRHRTAAADDDGAITVRPLPTAIVGAAVGLIVGLTSVGSGSLMIVTLLFMHPGLRSAELVGTDLVQAALLVGSAALGHAIFGAVEVGVTASLLLGALPGVYAGARVSARAPERVLRPVLGGVLLLTGLKLL